MTRKTKTVPYQIVPSAPVELREDGAIGAFGVPPSGGSDGSDRLKPELQTAPSTAPRMPSGLNPQPSTLPRLLFSSDTPFVRLYCGNCLELLDAIAAKYPEGRFDAIFADPSYFLPAAP